MKNKLKFHGGGGRGGVGSGVGWRDSCFLCKKMFGFFLVNSLIVHRNSLIGNSVFHQTQSDMRTFSNCHVILTFATKSKVKGAAISYCHLFILSKD